MGAQKPKRPPPGHSMLLPRTGADQSGNQDGSTVQRAFDAISKTVQQVQKTVAASQDAAAPNTTAGRMLAAPILLTGSGSGTLPDGTCVVLLEGAGQGGGGGGAAGGAGVGAGGGGSNGAYLRIAIGTPGTPLASLAYSWTAGAAGGAAGANTGGAGGTGSDSTITINGVTYTIKGGLGGAGGASSTTIAFSAGGGKQAGTSVGGYVVQDPGEPGVVTAGSAPQLGWGGDGGGGPMGSGGNVTAGATAGAGGDTDGFGGGGSGGCSVGATGRAGGAGAPGGLEITPYS